MFSENAYVFVNQNVDLDEAFTKKFEMFDVM